MTANEPRLPNLPREEWTDAAREVFSFWGEPESWENGSRTNTMMVLAHHPQLGMAYNRFGRHLLLETTLPAWPRELAVLRISWLLKAEYEWHHHVGYALNAGMTLEQIGAIREGPVSPEWADRPEDRAVLSSVDELWENSKLSEETWAVLSRSFDKKQLMDLVFTVGQYVMFTWFITTFEIPFEEGVDQIDWDLTTKSGRSATASFRPGETENWAEKSGV